MPRPRTLGARIQIQLPLTSDSVLRVRAARAGLTPAALAARILADALAPTTGPRREPVSKRDAIDRALAVETLTACQHPRANVATLASGMARCACGAVRGLDGVWR